MTMKSTLLQKIHSDYDKMIQDRFNEMVEKAANRGALIINSWDFFYKVVINHFEQASPAKQNKCESSFSYMCKEMNTAVEKAEFACAKPERENNRQYFS